MNTLKQIVYSNRSLSLGISAWLLFSGMITDTTCLTKVKKVFDAMNEAVVNNKVCYLKYVITSNLSTTNENKKNVVSTGTFEMITSKSQSRVYSKEMVVLKDEKNTFSILPSRKMIYWSDAVPSEKGDQLYDHLSQLQDSIFKNVQQVECINVKDKAHTKMVSIYLNEKMSSFLGIRKATYFFNEQTSVLNKVEVIYLPGNTYERLTYDFTEVNLDYKKEDMHVPVEQLVFENGKKMQKAYLGYQVKDNRKNKLHTHE